MATLGLTARRLAALAVGLTAAGIGLWGADARAQDPVEFSVHVQQRLGGDADDDGITDGHRTPATAVDDQEVTLELELGASDCDPEAEVEWLLNDVPTVAVESDECTFQLAVPEGDYEISVLVRGADGERTGARPIAARDHVVVSLGDSVASGEGNPDRGGHLLKSARWLDRRCHRSMRSAAARAAIDLERGERTSRVTFVPLGCSGASIPRGLLGSYRGFERIGDERVRPQVDELADIAGRREVDAVVINVGGNDVWFADIVRFCVVVSDCETRRFQVGQLGEAKDPAAPALAEFVADELGALAESLDRLADRIPDEIPAERIVLGEYFDPTVGPDGTCKVFGGRITREEAKWAQREVVAPLNAVLRAAAERHDWRLVDGVADAFQGHGICAGDERWVISPTKSILQQRGFDPDVLLSGTLHPNEDGHRQIARLIRPELAAAVDAELDESLLTPFEDESGGPSAFAWFLIGIGAAVLLALAVATGVLVFRRPE